VSVITFWELGSGFSVSDRKSISGTLGVISKEKCPIVLKMGRTKKK